MKNKKEENTILDIFFKILVVITILIFATIILNQPKGSYSFKENKLRVDNVRKSNTDESMSPTELKWKDTFKGISNEK